MKSYGIGLLLMGVLVSFCGIVYWQSQTHQMVQESLTMKKPQKASLTWKTGPNAQDTFTASIERTPNQPIEDFVAAFVAHVESFQEVYPKWQ